MVIDPISSRLKDGREALLRCPTSEDAQAFLENYRLCVAETPFLNMTPEEAAAISLEEERGFIRGYGASPDRLLLCCVVEGTLAGSCNVEFLTSLKSRHRGQIGIAIQRRFWGQGIGSAMFRAMIGLARSREGVTQLELNVFEGNTRARALYEKMGFRVCAVLPDAVRLPDGTLLNEYMMILKL